MCVYWVTKLNGEVSSEISVSNGVPPGSTLGPLLFLLYINDINTTVRACTIHLFADDTLLYFYSKDLKHLISTINRDLKILHDYFNINILKLNTKKTKFMLIANAKFQQEFHINNLNLKIGNELIERVDQIKYLGFIIDSYLNFKEHIIFIVDKITKNINFMSRLSASLTQWSKLTVFNTLVLPHFIFSSSILYLANKNDINRLQKLQNRAMRIILGERRDTPIRDMLARLDWLSVEQFLKYQVMTFIYRIKNSLTPSYLTGKLLTNDSVHSYPTRNKRNFYVMAKNKRVQKIRYIIRDCLLSILFQRKLKRSKILIHLKEN